MNTLLLIFLAPFLTSTAVGQVESVQIQSSFFETTALKFYCRYGSVLNEDVSGCTPKTVVQEQPQQTVQEKVVEVVRNVFVPVASAQEPSDSYLESMIRRIVLELLPQPQVITVKGEKGDKGDKGDPGTSGSNLLAFDGIQMPFWSGYGSGPSTSGGSTVINNNVNVTSNTLSYSTTTGLLTSDVGGVIGTTTILVTSSSAPSWLLAGNAGTNSATDFLGTTDAQDLVFRTNNVEQLRITQTGRLLAPNATDSIFIDGGNETMTGVSNIGIGDGAVGSNITGISNIALGQNALLFNTTGFSNMAIGQATLLMNNGNTNTAIGQGAGIVSTGNSNTYIGYGAGNAQSSGDNNIVIGQLANTGNGIGSNQLSIGNWIYGDNGNIGIGQSLPTERLDVLGNLRLDGAFMPGNNAGGSNQVLLSQGAGVAPIWVATSSLGLVGALVTADNGLTVNPANNVQLGGRLLQNTSIEINDGFGGFSFEIGPNAGEPLFKVDNGTQTASLGDDNGWSTGTVIEADVQNNQLRFSTNLLERMRIDIGGNIGIGTTTPSERLDVLGNIRFSGALMPNNLSGATGTVLMSQGAGLAPVWTGTSSLGLLNHWQKNTNVLSPNDAAVYQIAVTNNSASTLTGFKTTNTNDVSNYAGAVMELKGSGADFTNNVYFGKYGSAFYIPSWAGNGVLATDKSLVLGALGNSSNINFQVSGGYIAPVTKMTLSSTTLRLISANFRLDGAFMPNNLAGATGTLLMSQGAGLAPIWTATSSLNLSVSSSSIASNFGFIQNGNSFGTTATLGTNDTFDLQFETNNTVRMALTQAGRLTFSNALANIFLGGGNEIMTGTGNAGVGISALASNTTGYNNVASGYSALFANTDGYNNVANGVLALAGNTIGYNNTANGTVAMQFNTSGMNNVASGASALRFNDTGSNNVALGVQAGYNTVSGVHNVIIGRDSLMGNVAGSRNIAVGSYALINNTSNNNTALGYEAGYSLTSGTENTFLGYNTNTASGTITNATAVGANVALARSNTLILGNNVNVGIGTNTPLFLFHVGSASIVSGTTVARFENAGGTCDVTPNVAGGITCTSDQNLKKDIESIDPIDTLTRLLTVEVKSYRMNADEVTSTKQVGFLAQQLETQFPGLVLTNEEGKKSVSYAGMTPVLTQAVQTIYKFFTDIGVVIENGVAKVNEFVANRVRTKELCVGEEGNETCITKGQLDALLSGQGVAAAPASGITDDSQGGSQGQTGTSTDPVASSTDPVLDPAPVEPTPEDLTTDPVVDPTPVDPTPTETTSTEPAPVEESPAVDSAPVDPTPTE